MVLWHANRNGGGGFVGDDWRQDATRRAKVALIDTSAPNMARVGDYLYGGPNNFEADRKAARTLIAAAPATATIAPAARAFRHRVVRYLAGEARVTQFIDIGPGLAAAGNTHEVAQAIAPEGRVVYVDNDPVVLAHARALMTSTACGAIGFVDADIHTPDAIVADARTTLDLGRPVAVMLLSTLAAVSDNATAAALVSSLAAAVPSGQLHRPLPRGERPGSGDAAGRQRVEQDVRAAGHAPLPHRDRPPGGGPGAGLPRPRAHLRVAPGRRRPALRGHGPGPRRGGAQALTEATAVADDWWQDDTRRAKADLIDTTVPNAARVGDYLYGGRDNFEADRKAARTLVAAAPILAAIVPAMRAFHRRVVRYLVTEAGIRQFLDIGTRLAASGNTHEIAQGFVPECRIVYADNDPVVLAHARALTTSAPGGATSVIDGDVRDPGAIVAEARTVLDFGRPVAVLLLFTLAHLDSAEAAGAVVSSLAGALPPGSHIAVYHLASDLDPTLPAAFRQWNAMSPQPVTLRSHDEVAGLLAGLDPVPPGVVPITDWRPEPGDPAIDDVIPMWGVVARKL